jgi:hypothetical protein
MATDEKQYNTNYKVLLAPRPTFFTRLEALNVD